MIAGHDAAALVWFFSEGQSFEAQSVMGAMLERQAGLAVGLGECRRCRGTGFLGGKPTDLIDAAAHPRVKDPDATCDRCEGSGMVMVRHSCSGAASGCATLACGRCRGVTGNADCPHCEGAGYLAVGRAAPTTPLPAARDAHPPCGRLHSRFANLSRRVYRLGRADARTLATYYGDPGQFWERHGGRLLSLYRLTDAGRELLREEARDDANADDVLKSLLQLERVRPVPERTRAIGQADRQARELYQAAAESWAHA